MNEDNAEPLRPGASKPDSRTDAPRDVGRFMRERRSELGMSCEELAFRLGVTIRAVANWEKDPSWLPVGAQLSRLASVLGVPVADLIAPHRRDYADVERDVLESLERMSDAQRDSLNHMLEEFLKRKRKEDGRS
jgi:transcriptional regulator with XRE-family HTH domain